MKSELTRKYGALMAFCMVVGTVIGSGIFFRNENILAVIGGNMWYGVAAWGIGGLITLVISYVFATLAVKHEDAKGLVGIAEKMVGRPYGYLFGWFLATIFFPSLTGILALVSARFTVILLEFPVENAWFSGYTYLIALFYLIAVYSMTTLAPKLAQRFHISCTFLKVVPLILMAVVGTIAGLMNGTTLDNLQMGYAPLTEVNNPFFVALIATIFAYIGWEAVMNIAGEVKNPKRNLPLAVVGGMLVIMTIYVMYFVGVFSATNIGALATGDLPPNEVVMSAFTGLFSQIGGTGLFVFIIISCLGTLNGLMIGGQKTFYALATRKSGFSPDLFSQVDDVTNMPNNSANLFLFAVAAWMVLFGANFAGWYGEFWSNISGGAVGTFDIAGLVPITLNGFLIPVLIMTIVKEKDFGWFNRFAAPIAALAGACFLVYAVWYTQSWAAAFYLACFAAVMGIGMLKYRKKQDEDDGDGKQEATPQLQEA